MTRVSYLASAGVFVAAIGLAHAEPEDCRAAASLLKKAYEAPDTPQWGPLMSDAKRSSDACLQSLTKRVDDCRVRFPERDAECRPYVIRQDACTQVLDAYALAIKKRTGAADLPQPVRDDPSDEIARGKRFESLCFEAAKPAA